MKSLIQSIKVLLLFKFGQTTVMLEIDGLNPTWTYFMKSLIQNVSILISATLPYRK